MQKRFSQSKWVLVVLRGLTVEPTVAGEFHTIASNSSGSSFVALEEAPSYAKCWERDDGKCLQHVKADLPRRG